MNTMRHQVFIKPQDFVVENCNNMSTGSSRGMQQLQTSYIMTLTLLCKRDLSSASCWNECQYQSRKVWKSLPPKSMFSCEPDISQLKLEGEYITFSSQLNVHPSVLQDLHLWQIWYLFNSRPDSTFRFWEGLVATDFLTSSILRSMFEIVQNMPEVWMGSSSKSPPWPSQNGHETQVCIFSLTVEMNFTGGVRWLLFDNSTACHKK
jgi:hypothetical protein